MTDSTPYEAGAKDFVFVCKKQPFAITCSPSLPKTHETFVDLDLVLRMNIPMKNLQCTRLTFAGQYTRIVGQISQTVQCVVAGKALGSSHLKAKVVRDLNKLFNTDCLANEKLSNKLMDTPTLNKNDTNITTGTTDNFTNVSRVIVNKSPDSLNSDHEDNSVLNTSHDAELAMFLASQGKDAMSQAVDDYPELAKYCQQEETYYDKDLGYYGSMVDSTKGCSNEYNAPNSRPHEDDRLVSCPHEDKKLISCPQKDDVLVSCPQKEDVLISCPREKGCSISSVPVMSHRSGNTRFGSVPSPWRPPSQPSHQPMPRASKSPQISDLSCQPYESSDLVQATNDVQNDDLQELIAGHGYDDHGPCDYETDDFDAAEFFCRLCQVSGQPPYIFFSHNLLHPQCPSNLSEDEEDGG